ncbi:MAG: hypothetical protein NC177_15135 [Ruminococcus flavefaciens]|nr:hypothetical protein [Ruminococcus flavefaciens]
MLTEEGISSMQVSNEVANELKKLSDAIENTKKVAQSIYDMSSSQITIKTTENKEIIIHAYEFNRNGINECTLADNRTVSNCGEIWASREAILNGVKFEDLDLSTYCNIKSTKYGGLGGFMEKCENCQVTFKDIDLVDLWRSIENAK